MQKRGSLRVILAHTLFLVLLHGAHARPLVGDFDGDGDTDIGIWDETRNRALLDPSLQGRIAGITPPLGKATGISFMGDWDGNGVDTLALYRQATNELIWCRSNKSDGCSVRVVDAVGKRRGIPVRGDWDGDGRDGFAIYDIATRTFTFYQDVVSAAFAKRDVGNPSDVPVSGDWNNDGRDGYGVYRPSTREFWLYDAIEAPPAVHIASVGKPGDWPLVGRWSARTRESIGLFRPSTSTFLLYDSLNATRFRSVTWRDPTSLVSTAGRQLFYTDGVPHTGVAGQRRSTYSPTDSFLPLGIYAIGDQLNEQGGNIFAELESVGFNVVMTWPTLPVAAAIAHAEGTKVRLIPRFTEADVRAHDASRRIFAWYTADEPQGAKVRAALEKLYDTNRPKVAHPLFHTNTPPSSDPEWRAIAAMGDVAAVDDYPIRRPAERVSTIESVAESVSALRSTVPAGTPIWFVPQAFESNNPKDTWEMPAANQYRAMAYTAFVHGAAGLLTFARHTSAMLHGGNLGISPSPAPTYPGCTYGGRRCAIPSAAAKARSQALWSRMAGMNAEFNELKPALLSPTSKLAYTVDVLQVPHGGTSPIRTLLKTSPSGACLIAVNMTNDTLDALIQLPISLASVDVQFERRKLDAPLGAIRDRFGPFAVHVYKWQ